MLSLLQTNSYVYCWKQNYTKYQLDAISIKYHLQV